MVRKTLCVNSHTILSCPSWPAALRRHADAMRRHETAPEPTRFAGVPTGWRDGRRGSRGCSRPRTRLRSRERSLILAASGQDAEGAEVRRQELRRRGGPEGEVRARPVVARAREDRSSTGPARGRRADPGGRSGDRRHRERRSRTSAPCAGAVLTRDARLTTRWLVARPGCLGAYRAVRRGPRRTAKSACRTDDRQGEEQAERRRAAMSTEVDRGDRRHRRRPAPSGRPASWPGRGPCRR